ncbi:hypothetical protein C8Q79DRAFT_75073 [Trametes meyenii]|nr:hypothetical protein C8Q79DRAFT_75073 [Trametes meyenii]
MRSPPEARATKDVYGEFVCITHCRTRSFLPCGEVPTPPVPMPCMLSARASGTLVMPRPGWDCPSK